MKKLFRYKNVKLVVFSGLIFGLFYDKDSRYHTLIIFMGVIGIEIEIPKKDKRKF
jgi:hypothetical protein